MAVSILSVANSITSSLCETLMEISLVITIGNNSYKVQWRYYIDDTHFCKQIYNAYRRERSASIIKRLMILLDIEIIFTTSVTNINMKKQ